MKNASILESNVTELPEIRIQLRTWSPGIANHHCPPRIVNGGKPFVIQLEDKAMRTADDASLATQFA